jgi:putative ABC transport system permease protein
MKAVRQIVAVTLISLRAIPQRLGASLVVVVGMAGVVAVTISILSMSTGFMRTIHNSGRVDRVIVLSRNSQYEFASSITRENALAIADAPGLRHAADGKPIVSAEALTTTLVTKKSNGLDSYMVLRGIGPEGLALRPEIKLTKGRMFRPATHEVIVGKSAQNEFEGLDVGDKVSLPDGDWTVTGSFETGGSGTESEVIADSETLLSGLRANAFKSMTVMLGEPADFERFKAALSGNPTLLVDVFH